MSAFIDNFKINAAIAYKCKPDDIIIVNVNKGSVEIEYMVKEINL
jgi:hypothetical protein